MQTSRQPRITSRRRRAPVPAWMRDRALLEQFHRESLKAVGMTPLSPGTLRLRTVLDLAIQELQTRLEEAKKQPIPF